MARVQLSAELVVDGRVPQELAVSPDGRWIAYVVATVGRVGDHPVGELWGPFESALDGSTGWEGTGPHRHDRLSPVSYASRIRTPVLILHGENDTNVPVSQAEYFHRALRRFDVEHEYVVYPREGHPIRERGHQLDVLRRTRDWFDRWLA